MKTCYKCEQTLPIKIFVKRGTGYLNICKPCENIRKKVYRSTPKAKAQQKEYREANKDRTKVYMKNYHQVRTYGITADEKELMLIAQGNRCAICRTTEPGGTHNEFHTDHNHVTGEVRGLLCFTCNRNLGYYELYKDKCEDYLRRYNNG